MLRTMLRFLFDEIPHTENRYTFEMHQIPNSPDNFHYIDDLIKIWTQMNWNLVHFTSLFHHSMILTDYWPLGASRRCSQSVENPSSTILVSLRSSTQIFANAYRKVHAQCRHHFNSYSIGIATMMRLR